MEEKDRPTSNAGDPNESCGATVEQHIMDVWSGMMIVGLGSHCREVYRALVEMAEAVRLEGGFDPYVAKGGNFVKDVVNAAMERAKAEVQRRREQAGRSSELHQGPMEYDPWDKLPKQ